MKSIGKILGDFVRGTEIVDDDDDDVVRIGDFVRGTEIVDDDDDDVVRIGDFVRGTEIVDDDVVRIGDFVRGTEIVDDDDDFARFEGAVLGNRIFFDFFLNGLFFWIAERQNINLNSKK
jgi:hypothetical protein